MSVLSHGLLIPSAVVVVRPGGVLQHPLGRLFLAERHSICHIASMPASPNDALAAISPGQVRAARALIEWTRDQLATASSVPLRTLARFEHGEGAPQRRTLAAIRAALEVAGVEFIEENGGGPGVRLKFVSSDQEVPSMVKIEVVVREAGRLKPDYSLKFSVPSVPAVGSYLSIQRPDTPAPYGEDLIVRQVWWRLNHPETRGIVTDGREKTGQVNEIFVECDQAISPYSSDKWRDGLSSALETGRVEQMKVDRFSVRQDGK